MTTKRITRVLVLCAALALTRESRAQGGDLDILSRTVPPIVMIQFDTSGSMRNVILPQKYITDRGTGSPSVRFNTPTNDATNRPASRLVSGAAPNNFTSVTSSSSSEDFRPMCQIFPNSTTVARNQSICFPGTTGCTDDDADGSSPQSGVTLRCWSMPGGCTYVPAGLTCTTANRNRNRTSGGAVSTPYTIITFPDVSYTLTTNYPVNYLWWIAQEIFKGNVPIAYINQDRNGAAKQAIAQLVNDINVDGFPPRVKFGLFRYSENTGDDNGGFTVVPADLNNKTTFLSTLATLPASGNTPLSESLVDLGRYLAGTDRLGTYPTYNRDLTGATNAAGTPPTPLTSSCEKIFAIVVTDGLPTADDNNHYTTQGSAGGNAFTQTFAGFIDGDGSYLDDVAKKLYATDLRTTLSGNQNVITYTVGFTVASPLLQDAATQGHGLYFQSNNADDLADSLTQAITDIIQRNTSLTSATVPSLRSAYGNGFYTAYFLPTGRKSVWPGHLEAYTLSSQLVVLDDANNPAIDPVTKLFYEPRHPHWDARDTLIADYASRTIWTTKAGARVPFTTANLADPTVAAPTTGQLTPTDFALTAADKTTYPQPSTHVSVTDTGAPAASLKRLGDSIIDFVRGTDSFDEDGDGLRTDVRPFVFGDVFHSSPVVVGPALTSLRFEPGYGPATDSSSFIGQFAHRERILYVGANDGMLHGFHAGSFVDPSAAAGDEYYDSGNGHEIFGYVPGSLLPKIKNLPRDDFGKSYYVDGSPAAADIWLDYNTNGTKEGTDWTTTLVTPLREGGESLLALDITNPAATSGNHSPYPRLMWEFSHADLGQTWSRPIITRVKMRGAAGSGDKCGANDGDGDCVETWVAIFGAGYSTAANPNMTTFITDPNSAGYAKSRGLFIVRMSDGTVLAHLKPDSSATFSKMKYAMPAEPAVVDYNADGFADLVYEGDLGGQLWKWDISAVGTTVSGVVPTSVWPAGVLFEAPVATIAAGAKHYHSIFQSAGVALTNHVLTVSFASGERTDLGFVGASDPNDPNNPLGRYDDNNRLWVLFDKHPTGTGSLPSNLPIYETPPMLPGHDVLTDITNTSFDGDPNDAGYFFRVPDGHKFITDQLIFSGTVVMLSYLPDLAGAGASGSCALGGTTFEFAWELANGAGVLTSSGGAGQPPAGTAMRSQPLGNGAPTNPRITISITDTGDVLVKGIAQTSSGEVGSPAGLPDQFDVMKSVYWRQEF
jgi:type IV pilus assembly protein PilY1